MVFANFGWCWMILDGLGWYGWYLDGSVSFPSHVERFQKVVVWPESSSMYSGSTVVQLSLQLSSQSLMNEPKNSG